MRLINQKAIGLPFCHEFDGGVFTFVNDPFRKWNLSERVRLGKTGTRSIVNLKSATI